MHPHQMYHHQQYQYQYAPYHPHLPHPNSRSSSSALSSMIDHEHMALQQQQAAASQGAQQPPQTPFDMAYGASMLPRQLLIGSPFVQTPMNGSPSRASFNANNGRGNNNNNNNNNATNNSDNSYFPSVITGSPSPMINAPPESARRRGYNYMSRPPAMRSLSVSSSSTSLTDFYNNSSTNSNSTKNLSNSRSVVIHDLPSMVTLNEFLDNVKVGPIEKCHFVDENDSSLGKSILVSFIDNKTAKRFYQEVTNNHKLAIALNAPNLKISWTSSSSILPFVSNAINNDSATRNVYIGNLSSKITKEFLEEELITYGNIDTIDFIQDRKIAFIHFTNIASAIKAVEQLPLDSNWSSCKIFYGKDRCSQNAPSQSSSSASNKISERTLKQLSDLGQTNNELLNSAFTQNTKAANTLASSGGTNNVGNRCVYLGNLHPATTVEEICNVIRGGLLQSIRLMNERHICFLTFIDPLAAVQFFASTNIDGLLVHGRKLKIGWGKHSGVLPNSIALAVTAGASRNLYIGVVNAEDAESLTHEAVKIPDESVLRQDFSEYGDIEQINFFKDGLCAFVNFMNISSAIKCVDEFQREELSSKFEGRYRSFKISFGKDRCGNPPKARKLKKTSKKISTISEHSELSNGNFEEKNKSNDVLVFASMGITSKSLATDKEEGDDSDTIKDAVGKSVNVDESPKPDLAEETVTNDSDGEQQEPEEEAKTPIKENHIIEDDKKPDNFMASADSLSVDYESSDSDSVSIVIGNNDTSLSPMTSKPSDSTTNTSAGQTVTSYTVASGTGNHPNGSSSSNNNSSRNLAYNKRGGSQYRTTRNNSRSSSFSYDNFPLYQSDGNGGGFNSRQSSKSQLNKYYQSGSQGQLNAFATSGSQVMAQYLAQSQHDNLLYATHVLTEDRDSRPQFHHRHSHRSSSGGVAGVVNGPEDAEDDDDDDEGAGNEFDDGYYYEEYEQAGMPLAAHPHHHHHYQPPQQAYAKLYSYPVQQYPYFLAAGPPPPPPPLQHMAAYVPPMHQAGGGNMNNMKKQNDYRNNNNKKKFAAGNK